MVVNDSPLVSIITPVCNGSDYLEELILSVRSQDYPNIEHIVIDDGSRDEGATVGVLHRHPYVSWWSQENKGQYATMNEGLRAAEGELVCFVSADDIVSTGAVSAVVKFWLEHPEYDGVFGLTGRMNSAGQKIPYFIPFQAAPLAFYPYFAHISHCSLYMKKESIVKSELFFDPSLYYVGDYEWMIRIRKAHLRIGFLRSELSRVRLHTNQASQRYSKDSRRETETVIARHQISRFAFGVLNRFYRTLFKIWYASQAAKKGEMTMLIQRRIDKYGSK